VFTCFPDAMMGFEDKELCVHVCVCVHVVYDGFFFQSANHNTRQCANDNNNSWSAGMAMAQRKILFWRKCSYRAR